MPGRHVLQDQALQIRHVVPAQRLVALQNRIAAWIDGRGIDADEAYAFGGEMLDESRREAREVFVEAIRLEEGIGAKQDPRRFDRYDHVRGLNTRATLDCDLHHLTGAEVQIERPGIDRCALAPEVARRI